MTAREHTVKECVCQGGQIEIPHWFDDVEAWATVYVICPICLGKKWRTPDEWDERQRELDPEFREKDKGEN